MLSRIIFSLSLSILLACSTHAVEFKKRGGNIITAYDSNGEEIGEIVFDKKLCWISSLQVDEEFRKQTIGSQLLQRAFDEMSACKNIGLASYLTAIDFYFKQGAKIDPRERCYTTQKSTHYKDLTKEEKAEYLNHLYQLKKNDPKRIRPYVQMNFSRTSPQ